jgi:hypothetical protein
VKGEGEGAATNWEWGETIAAPANAPIPINNCRRLLGVENTCSKLVGGIAEPTKAEIKSSLPGQFRFL